MIQTEIKQSVDQTYKVIDRKADAMDMQQQLDRKADTKVIDINFADREQVEQMVQNINAILETLDNKCDLQSKYNFNERLTLDYCRIRGI